VPPALIALLTDFGLEDAFAGILRAVIAGIAPQVSVIDLTHQIPLGDVRRAAFTLWQARTYVPPGTIFLCVVDPGVGSSRRGVALIWERYAYVGPDNGAASYLMAGDGPPAAFELTAPEYRLDPVSNTFHGRDLFAPAAAHLAAGLNPERLGRRIRALEQLPAPLLEVRPRQGARGVLLHADRFGNCISTVGVLVDRGDHLALEPWLRQDTAITLPKQGLQVELAGGVTVPLGRQFADVPRGEALAYIGSSGLLEIGVHHGSALEQLNLSEGQPVRLEKRG
jgi:S-adenosylmethionine hydrolase